MKSTGIAALVVVALLASGCGRDAGKGGSRPTPTPTSSPAIASPFSTTLPMNLGLLDNDAAAHALPTKAVWVDLEYVPGKICPGGQLMKGTFAGHVPGGSQPNQAVFVALCPGTNFPTGVKKPRPKDANQSTTLPMNLGLLENSTTGKAVAPATAVMWVDIEIDDKAPVCAGGSPVLGPTKAFDGHLAGAPGTMYKKVSLAICRGAAYPAGTASPDPTVV